MNLFGIISRPFGQLLLWLIGLVGNYGAALILFTVIVRLILLPLAVKQQKSMMETQKIQPELAKIREKYKNDKQKLNDEMMNLYKEHNVNPAGGCLPLLIQFPIIIGLFSVIRQPLTYMYNLTSEQIKNLADAVGYFVEKGQLDELQIAHSLTPEILQNAGLNNIGIIDFNFLGMNLSKTPVFGMNTIDILWLIPIFAAITTYLSTKVMSAVNQNQNANDSAASTMKMMNMIFPFMTAMFAFQMPAGVGLYWILGNIIQIPQQILLNRYFNAKKASEPLVVEKKEPKPNKGGGKKR